MQRIWWFVRDVMEVLRLECAMEGAHIRTATIFRDVELLPAGEVDLR